MQAISALLSQDTAFPGDLSLTSPPSRAPLEAPRNDLVLRHFLIPDYLLEADALWSCFRGSTRERSARPTTFHNRVTIATVMIHRSNLARSMPNSMSAAKRIERDAVRIIGNLRQCISCLFHPLSLLLPTASQCLVKLNEGQTLVELGLHQVELRREIIRFAGKHLEVTRTAILIKHLR